MNNNSLAYSTHTAILYSDHCHDMYHITKFFPIHRPTDLLTNVVIQSQPHVRGLEGYK